jgi:hypothetical protein
MALSANDCDRVQVEARLLLPTRAVPDRQLFRARQPCPRAGKTTTQATIAARPHLRLALSRLFEQTVRRAWLIW